MKKILTLMAIATFATGAALVSQAKSAEDAYQEALQQEEVKGDLLKAIAAYQSIIERFGEDRSVAAKAQLHMGLSYDRLGKSAEAATAYEKVVRRTRSKRL